MNRIRVGAVLCPNTALRAERHSGLNALLQSLMFTVAAGLVFGLHWKLAQREHATEGPLLSDPTPR